MIRDGSVIKHITTCGLQDDALLLAAIDEELMQNRYLDTVPAKVPLVELTKSNERYGTTEQFCSYYKMNYNGADDVPSKLVMRTTTYIIDYTILTAIRTLIRCGISKSETKAIACRLLLKEIKDCATSSLTITAGNVYASLAVSGEYYHDALLTGIIESCFTADERFWFECRKLLDDPSLSADCARILKSANVSTIKELSEFIKQKYKTVTKERRKGCTKLAAIIREDMA